MKQFLQYLSAASIGCIASYLLLCVVFLQFPVDIFAMGYQAQKASIMAILIGGCIGLLSYMVVTDDE